MSRKADIMVITPHPDDAEFGVAGTVARLIREGRQAVYIVCTSGEKGTDDRSIKPEQLAEIREQEQQAAAGLLGVQEVVFLRYPDQGLEDTPAFRKAMVRLIRKYRPGTVVTADPYRRYLWHRDHRITGQVVLDAVFPYARDYWAYPDLTEEGLEPHAVKDILFWAAEDINYRSDITATFDVKYEALCCHRSQLRDFNPPEMKTFLRQFCQRLAEGERFELAEAFHRVDFSQYHPSYYKQKQP